MKLQIKTNYLNFIWLIALLPIMLLRDFTPSNELRYLSIVDEALRNGTLFKFILIATPVVAFGLMLKDLPMYIANFFKNENIPVWLVVFGSIGQLIFSLRFVYQWLIS